LQQIMTNRQVASMGQELGQLSPESPDWAQKAVQLGSRYPLAMKSPQGQFMLGTQAKAHAEWTQVQRAEASAKATMGRQIGMENLRTQNDLRVEDLRQKNRLALAQERGDAGVDLLGADAQPVQRNPAQGISFGTDETAPTAMEEVSGTAPLTGMDGLLPDISQRALSPLRAAQGATGVKPTRSQVFSAIAQEDRQMQQEKIAAEKSTLKATEDEKKAAAAAKETALRESRFERSQQRLLLQNQLSSVDREIDQHRRALTAHTAKPDDSEEFFARKAELQSYLEQAGKEQMRLKKALDALTEGNSIAAEPTTGKKLYKFDPAKGLPLPQ
jgi:hypothetical protein